MESTDAKACLEINFIPDVEVDVAISPWILDNGTSKTRETNYHNTINLY
jgi:hypothetical protein